jgi:(2Fe-2S) ferredoxin
MSHYTRHIFFCANQREDGKACCSQLGGGEMYRYAKDKCRNEGKLGLGKLGVSQSHCLGRCEFGPVVVVYPDNVWYQYIDKEDIDEIITKHLTNGKIVKRLQID